MYSSCLAYSSSDENSNKSVSNALKGSYQSETICGMLKTERTVVESG